MSHNRPAPRSALAVGAHPDDIEFGCGATLAKWAAQGCAIHYLVCTDGSKGTWNADADTVALARTRQVEQRAAAAMIAGQQLASVAFLARVDGDLVADRETIAEVVAAIRTTQPQVVLGHDPWKRYRLHPDHRNAGTIVCDAIVAARDPHFFREQGLAPHRPDALLLWEADAPDHAEDVSDYVDVKLRGLEAHTSQFESTMGAHDATQLDAFRLRIRRRLADLGASDGFDAAEVFKLIDDL